MQPEGRNKSTTAACACQHLSCSSAAGLHNMHPEGPVPRGQAEGCPAGQAGEAGSTAPLPSASCAVFTWVSEHVVLRLLLRQVVELGKENQQLKAAASTVGARCIFTVCVPVASTDSSRTLAGHGSGREAAPDTGVQQGGSQGELQVGSAAGSAPKRVGQDSVRLTPPPVAARAAV